MIFILFLFLLLPFKASSFHTGLTGVVAPIKIAGAVAALYAAWRLIASGRSPRFLRTVQARLFVLFLLVVGLSAVRDPRYSLIPALQVLCLLVLYFVLLGAVDNLKRLRAVLVTVILSIALASIYTTRDWAIHRGWETGFRPGYIIDSNNFPITAVCGIALAWYLAQGSKLGWRRLFFWACALLDVVAILTGGSRGGLLGLFATVLVILARSRKRMRNLLIFALIIMGFNLAYSHSPLQRLLHPDRIDKESSMAHKASWVAGYRMVCTYPITGIGLGKFKWEMDQYAPSWYDGVPTMAHNAYISVGAELGLPALLLYLGTVIGCYRSLGRVRQMKSAPKLITKTATALQAAFVGECVSVSFIPAAYHEYLWLVIFLSMCLPTLAIRFRRKPQRHLRPVENSAALDLELVQV